jgi:hypothetical protein
LTSGLTLGLTEMLVTASAALPLFVIVSVVDLVVPTVTSPRARLPLSVMTRVDFVGDVGPDRNRCTESTPATER